jgi:hypothetical protein
MRSNVIPQFAKVEGHVSLTRDMSSNAIICNNDDEYQAYRRRNDIAKAQAKIVLEQTNQIESLKSEVEEIKQMLIQILKGK